MGRARHILGVVVALLLLLPTVTIGQTILELAVPDAGSASHENKASELVRLKPGYSFKPDAGSGNVMHAFIDPSIINETDYADQLYGGGGESWPPQIDQSKAVGFTPGSHSVTPTGAAAYDIPIQLPPGTAGIAPSLSISYNSQSGNGLLGMGWNIAGLSAITRVPNTYYHNEAIKGVKLDHTDAFALDGNRLIATDGTYGLSGCEYGTEQETFSKVISHGYYGAPDGSATDGGPEWFEVKTKEGMTLHYGNSEDSRFWTGDGSKVIVHRINKMIDQYGNYITFKYRNIDRQSVIEEIRYTGNDNANVQPYNVVQFEYDERQDKNTVYVNGFYSDVKSNLLLRKIRIIADGQHFKNYEFDYGLKIYSFLKSVSESGANGEELNSTQFKYGEEDVLFEMTGSNAISGEAHVFTGDFSGDGVTDVVVGVWDYANQRHTHLRYHQNAFASSSSNPSPYFGNTPTTIVELENEEVAGIQFELAGSRSYSSADFLGKGYDQLLVAEKHVESSVSVILDNVRIYDFNGSLTWTEYSPSALCCPEFATTQLYNKIHPSAQRIFPGDFDGDGSVDFISILTGNNYTRLFITYPRISPNFLNQPLSEDWELVSDIVGSPSMAGAEVRIIDFNGDGKHDIMTTKGSITSIYTFTNVSGTIQYEVLYSSGFPSILHDVLPGDFNGDGKTDMLVKVPDFNEWHVAYSTGEGFREVNFNNPLPWTTAPSYNIERVDLGDFNGDGKTDIIHVNHTPSHTNVVKVYHSTGEGFTIQQHDFVDEEYSFAYTMVGGDFNGDGKSDKLVRKYINDPFDMWCFKRNSTENQLNEVVDGLGRSIEFGYAYLPQGTSTMHYSSGSNTYQYPVVKMRPALQVVNAVHTPDGIGGLLTNRYHYSEFKVHRHGRGFIGFTNITIKAFSGSALLSRTVQEFDYNSSFAVAYPKTIKRYFGTMESSLMSESVQEYQFMPLNIGTRYWMKPRKTTDIDHLNGFTTTTDYNNYDMFGNARHLTVTNNAGTVFSNLQYTSFGSWFADSRPLSVTITSTRTGETAMTKTVSYPEYDNFGGLLREVSLGITTEYNRDGFGNVLSTTVSASGQPSRTVSAVFDPKGRFAVETVNEFEQSSFAQIDGRWGKPTSVTDILGHSSSFTYDAFGRLKQTTDPFGNTVTTLHTWDPGTVPNSRYKVQTVADGAPTSRAYFDLLGRELRTETQLLQQTIATETNYDVRGRVVTTTVPSALAGGTSITTTFGYNDDNNRMVSSTNGVHSASYNYTAIGGLVTTSVTDQNGVMRTTKSDAAGKVIESTDPGGALNFTYFSNGKPKSTGMGDQTLVQMAYDPNFHQDNLWDVNGGTTDYTYTAYGQLTAQIDANNNTYDMTYDATGRMQSKVGPDENITYTYYNSGGGLNQPKKIDGGNGYATEYVYDGYGRLTELTETVENTPLEFGYAYDDQGRVASITYPTGFKVLHTYSSDGVLTEVNTATGDPIYALSTLNALGQVKEYALGNDVTTEKFFNDFGMVEDIIANGVIEHTYGWDAATGNLGWRADQMQGLIEEFNYDALNRLKEAQVDNGTPLAVFYEDNGNIESKSDVGDYTYLEDKVNAVRTVTNPDTEISLETQYVSYTTFDRTADIMEEIHKAVFHYGPSHDRRKMEMIDLPSNGVVSYRYYTGSYEELHLSDGNTYKLHYISGGDGLCAIHVMHQPATGGAVAETFFVYKDYLGSIVALTDADGNVVHRQSFDAWGKKRNPDNWTDDFTGFSQPEFADSDLPNPAVWLNRGYTGHEHLDEFALINMNNRMYDPEVGRMLAVDNFVQEPFSTQAYNRYTYAANNPLTYVDPNGEEPFSVTAIIAGAMIGAFTGATITGWSGGSPGDIMGGFAIGGFSGAASAGAGSAVAGAIGAGAWAGAGIVGTLAGGGVGGFVNGAIWGAYQGKNPLETGGIGFVAGTVGGGVSGAVGGGIGAFLGGAASGAVSSAMNGGGEQDILFSTLAGGVLSYAGYEINMLAAYQDYNGSMGNLTYGGYRSISIAYQRANNWAIEVGGNILHDGSVADVTFGKRSTVTIPGNEKSRANFHSHPENSSPSWSPDIENETGNAYVIARDKVFYLSKSARDELFSYYSKNYRSSPEGAYYLSVSNGNTVGLQILPNQLLFNNFNNPLYYLIHRVP